MSHRVEFDRDTMRLKQTTPADFEKLCRLLGLADTPQNDQEAVMKISRTIPCKIQQVGTKEPSLGIQSSCSAYKRDGKLTKINNVVKRLERSGSYKKV